METVRVGGEGRMEWGERSEIERQRKRKIEREREWY
jgi:hypothetical protein